MDVRLQWRIGFAFHWMEHIPLGPGWTLPAWVWRLWHWDLTHREPYLPTTTFWFSFCYKMNIWINSVSRGATGGSREQTTRQTSNNATLDYSLIFFWQKTSFLTAKRSLSVIKGGTWESGLPAVAARTAQYRYDELEAQTYLSVSYLISSKRLHFQKI